MGSDVVVGGDLSAVGGVGEGHGEAGEGDHRRAVLDMEGVERGFEELAVVTGDFGASERKG